MGQGSDGAVSAAAPVDRRSRRRQEVRAEIVDAAWGVVREHGLAGLSMRDLGARVGMRAQSIYSYFESKLDIYDAMFHEGYLAFSAALDEIEQEHGDSGGGAEVLVASAHRFFAFCTEDPVRYQLLFQRTIPDFVPSEASYAVALEVFDRMAQRFAAIGIDDPAAIDLWTALLTGLTDQQMSNDPGGDRWQRLIDRAVAMYVAANAPHLTDPSPEGNRP